jgi:hypothetical protein
LVEELYRRERRSDLKERNKKQERESKEGSC